MHSRVLALAIFFTSTVFTLSSHAELFKCKDAQGNTHFSDLPCSDSATPYQLKNNSTRLTLKTIELPEEFEKKTIKQKPLENNFCPRFTSTELRNLKVKREFKKGLPIAEIEKRYGRAPEMVMNGNTEKWVYQTEHVKRTFLFKNGCLSQWREKYFGEKSQISKYQ